MDGDTRYDHHSRVDVREKLQKHVDWNHAEILIPRPSDTEMETILRKGGVFEEKPEQTQLW